LSQRKLDADTKNGVGGLIVQSNLPVPTLQVAQMVNQHRLPPISLLPVFAESGGLMSYGASLGDIQRRAGSYVDKILKGANPAELPVERPTTF
jgi:putative tryptophan/tyrosine transport system substrate-binding protein